MTHQVAVCIGRLQRVASKLGHKLRHGMFVSLADMIQQSQGVILHATNKTQSQRHRRWWRSIVVKTYIHTYIHKEYLYSAYYPKYESLCTAVTKQQSLQLSYESCK